VHRASRKSHPVSKCVERIIIDEAERRPRWKCRGVKWSGVEWNGALNNQPEKRLGRRQGIKQINKPSRAERKSSVIHSVNLFCVSLQSNRLSTFLWAWFSRTSFGSHGARVCFPFGEKADVLVFSSAVTWRDWHPFGMEGGSKFEGAYVSNQHLRQHRFAYFGWLWKQKYRSSTQIVSQPELLC
jgi:hypothetical protein